jgi:hypothetical protein
VRDGFIFGSVVCMNMFDDARRGLKLRAKGEEMNWVGVAKEK